MVYAYLHLGWLINGVSKTRGDGQHIYSHNQPCKPAWLYRHITRQRWREKGAVMKIEKSLKKHLRRRHSNRKLTTQEQYDLKYFC